MPLQIRAFTAADLDAVVRLSLRAWEPVFVSIRESTGPEIDDALHPDWRAFQAKAVEDVCTTERIRVWVAEVADDVVGFVAVDLFDDGRVGEIYMLAVDPDHQRGGVGLALTNHAVAWIKDAGIPVAMVGTGGDPGHAPARSTYEKAGFTLVPMARYFKRL